MTAPSTPPLYRYHPEILEELAAAGIQPRGTTSPQLVRDFLRDLYRWEIRKLKERLLAHAFPKHEYAHRVLELRRRYVLLSVPLVAWTEPDAPAPGDSGPA